MHILKICIFMNRLTMHILKSAYCRNDMTMTINIQNSRMDSHTICIFVYRLSTSAEESSVWKSGKGKLYYTSSLSTIVVLQYYLYWSIPGGSGTLTHVSSHSTHFCDQRSMFYGTSRNMYVSTSPIAPRTAKYAG